MRYFFLGALLLVPTFAHAETLTCQFDMECFDTEGCSETSYEAVFTYQPKPLSPTGSVSRTTMSDVLGNRNGLMAKRSDVQSFMSGDVLIEPEWRMVVNSTGEARLTVTNANNPSVILYSGQCQESE